MLGVLQGSLDLKDTKQAVGTYGSLQIYRVLINYGTIHAKTAAAEEKP